LIIIWKVDKLTSSLWCLSNLDQHWKNRMKR